MAKASLIEVVQMKCRLDNLSYSLLMILSGRFASSWAQVFDIFPFLSILTIPHQHISIQWRKISRSLTYLEELKHKWTCDRCGKNLKLKTLKGKWNTSRHCKSGKDQKLCARRNSKISCPNKPSCWHMNEGLNRNIYISITFETSTKT